MTGTGIHVAGDRLCAVRLPGDGPAMVAEVAITRRDRTGMIDACIRVAARVGAVTTEPLRLAWSDARIELLDVSDADAATLATTVRGLAAAGFTALTNVTSRQRTYAVGIAWDHDGADALVADIRAAGFTDVAIEPAALSTRRLGERPAVEAAVPPEQAPAYGAALGAAGRAGPIGPIRPLDLAAVPHPPDAAWVLERLPDAAPGTAIRAGLVARVLAAVRRIRSAACAS